MKFLFIRREQRGYREEVTRFGFCQPTELQTIAIDFPAPSTEVFQLGCVSHYVQRKRKRVVDPQGDSIIDTSALQLPVSNPPPKTKSVSGSAQSATGPISILSG